MSESNSVPCPECGTPVDRDAASCRSCGHPFRKLCRCGAEFSILEGNCPGCGRTPGVRMKGPRVPRKVKLLILAFLVLGVLGGGILAMRQFLSGRNSGNVLLRRAKSDLAQEKFQSARVHLVKALEENGDHAETLYLLAAAEIGLERADEAAPRLRRALELEPDYVSARLSLANLELRAGRTAEAERHIRILLEVPNPPPAAHLLAGHLYLTDEFADPVAAEEHLRVALEGGVGGDSAILLLTDRLLDRLAGSGGKAPSPDSSVYLRKARAILAARVAEGEDSEELDRRVALLDLVLDQPEETEKTLAGRSADASRELIRARSLWSRGRKEKAVEAVRGLLDSDAGPRVLAELHAFLLSAGEEELAAEALRRGRDRFPEDARIVLARLSELMRDGLYEEAEQAAREGLEANPGHGALHVSLAEILERLERREEAEQFLRARVEVSAAVKLKLADLLLSGAGISPEALAEAEALLAGRGDLGNSSQFAWRRMLQGRLALLQGQARKAADALKAAIWLRPGNGQSRLLLAEAHRRLGERALEAEELTAAIEILGESVELLRARSRSLLAAGRSEAAARDATRALQLEPADSQAEMLWARSLLDRPEPDYERAVEILRGAARRPEVPAELPPLLAHALSALGREDDARAELRAALERSPPPDEELELRTMLVRFEAEPDPVAQNRARQEIFREFLSRHPGHVGAAWGLARALAGTGELEEAAEALESAIVAAPASPTLHRLMADIHLESRPSRESDRAAAERSAERVRELAPDGPDDLYLRARFAALDEDWERCREAAGRAVGLAPRDAYAWLFLGIARARLNQVEGAQVALQTALRQRPDLGKARELLAEIAFRSGVTRLEEGDAESAVGLLDEADRLAPGQPLVEKARLAALLRVAGKGDPRVLRRTRVACEARIEDLTDAKSEEERQELVGCLVLLGNLNFALGDLDLFLAATARHLEIAPDAPLAHSRRGIALVVSEHTEEGREVLEASLERFPGHPLLVHPLVLLELKEGRKDHALALAREAAGRRPDDPAVRLLFGAVAQRVDDLSTAETEFRAAWELGPAGAQAGPPLAGVLVARGEMDEAKDLLRKMLEEEATRETASILLADLLLREPDGAEEGISLLEGALGRENLTDRHRIVCNRLLLGTYIRTGRMALARRTASRFLAWREQWDEGGIDPSVLPVLDAALRSAGVAFQETGTDSPARRCYREVLERNPEDFQVLNNLAELLLSRRSTAAEAVKMAERAAEIEPEIAEVWDTVGRAKLRAGDPIGAIEAYGRAADLLRARIAADERSLSSRGNARLLADAELGTARAWLIQEEPGRAKAALKRAEQADPEIARDPDYAAARDALR